MAGFVRGRASQEIAEQGGRAGNRPPPGTASRTLARCPSPIAHPICRTCRSGASRPSPKSPPDPAAGSPPAWLAAAEPWEDLPVSDPRQLPPEQSVLVPRARQARVLRRQLAEPRGDGAVDMARLCQMLAAPQLCPALAPAGAGRAGRRGWICSFDLSLELRPFWDDFWQLATVLRHILGDRLRVAHPLG